MILRALSELWTSYAPQMANHLWQSTLSIVLAAMLAFALRKNQGRVRYWVWLTASMKFLLPFSLLIALGSHLAKPRASTPAQAVVYSAVEDFSQPFAGPELPSISQAPAPVSRFHLLPPIVVALWLAGIVIVLLVWTAGWIRVARMVRTAAPLREGPEAEALRRLESSCGVRKPIRLVLSRNWMEPGIFGTLRPVLIWPEGISQHLDDRHIDAILAHEICHARRHDNLTAILHMLVEAIFWFHPLVWWMGARLEEERERACDEEVSLLCNQPHIYAESILRVCKFCSESPLACVSGITGADLKKRIVQIMTERVARKLDLGRKLLLLAVGLCVAAVPIVLAQAKAAQRLMLAAVNVAPRSVQRVVGTIVPEIETLSVGVLPVQAPGTQEPLDREQLRFDVVSIHPAVPEASDLRRRRVGLLFTDDGVSIRNDGLEHLLQHAYELGNSGRILNAPGWAQSQRWDIEAKVADSDVPAYKIMDGNAQEGAHRRNLMLQELLVERFMLRAHKETREGTVYTLEVAKGGIKAKPAAAAADTNGNVEVSADGTPRLRSVLRFNMGPGNLDIPYGQVSSLASMLTANLGAPVIDKTGLTDFYRMKLDWQPDNGLSPSVEASTSSKPSLFTALQEQLGLKLVEGKGPVPVVVIDHIEKPTVEGAEVTPPASGSSAAQVQNINVPRQAAQNSTSSCPDAGGQFAAYDVVSVRPTNATPRFVGLQDKPDGISTETVTVAMMVQQAYSAVGMLPTDDAVARLPDWGKNEYFAVQAKMNPEQVAALASLSKDQQKGCRLRMLQTLLADRFKLQVHHETRQVMGYELVVADGGPKMKEVAASDPNVFIGSGGKPMLKNSMRIVPSNGGQEVVVQNFTIDQLAAVLAGPGAVDHMVVNKTGLAALYSYTLTFAISRGAGPAGTPSAPVAPDPGPTVFQALEDQLGLKLQRGIDTVDVVVADHIERPSEN